MNDLLLSVRGPEVRTYQECQFRDVDASASGRWLEGRAVPYDTWDNVGWYLEQHTLGEFTRSITEHPNMPLLLFHNRKSWPIGVVHEYRDNSDGLDCVWRLDGSDEAQRAAQLARDQMLTGLSIGFVPIRSDWTFADDWDPDEGPEHMDRVVRLESRLLEVSLTPTPAFAGAQVQLVRSRGSDRKISRPRPRAQEVEAWLKGRAR